jgi:peroxiredoxin
MGSALPTFKLESTDGSLFDSSELKGSPCSLIIFTCNHCPYVKGSEQLLNEVIKTYQSKGLKVVAISSNDAVAYPEDNFEKMQEKARTLKLTYPYLYDKTQEVARAFDAACTPECYLFNSEQKLTFHGTINDSPRDPSKATHQYLETALSQIFSGTQPEPAFVNPIGCSIKWVR